MRFRLLAAAPALAALAALGAHAAAPLPRLVIDPHQTTVSGLSAGGFMAVQLGYSPRDLETGLRETLAAG